MKLHMGYSGNNKVYNQTLWDVEVWEASPPSDLSPSLCNAVRTNRCCCLLPSKTQLKKIPIWIILSHTGTKIHDIAYIIIKILSGGSCIPTTKGRELSKLIYKKLTIHIYQQAPPFTGPQTPMERQICFFEWNLLFKNRTKLQFVISSLTSNIKNSIIENKLETVW